MELPRNIVVQARFSDVLNDIRSNPEDQKWNDEKYQEAKAWLKRPSDAIWQEHTFLCKHALKFEDDDEAVEN